MNFKEKLTQIKAFVFDVDGVFTDGSVILQPNGELTREMNVKDGFILNYCNQIGFPIAIITKGRSEAVRTRFNDLGIKDVYLGVSDKTEGYEEFLTIHDLTDDDILYMGDDIPDYDVMKRVAMPTCPADAVEEIKSISLYISDKNGGQGCVRDVIEQVLKVQGKWKKF